MSNDSKFINILLI